MQCRPWSLKEDGEGVSLYRVMDRQGELLDPKEDPNVRKNVQTEYLLLIVLRQLPDETLVKMHRTMMLLNTVDKILYDAQRQVGGGNRKLIEFTYYSKHSRFFFF